MIDVSVTLQVTYKSYLQQARRRKRRAIISDTLVEKWQKFLSWSLVRRRPRRSVMVVLHYIRLNKLTNVTISGLQPNTEYKFNVYAVNSGGTGPGAAISTRTLYDGKNQ